MALGHGAPRRFGRRRCQLMTQAFGITLTMTGGCCGSGVHRDPRAGVPALEDGTVTRSSACWPTPARASSRSRYSMMTGTRRHRRTTSAERVRPGAGAAGWFQRAPGRGRRPAAGPRRGRGALSPDGTLLYVTTYGAYGRHGKLLVIDASRRRAGRASARRRCGRGGSSRCRWRYPRTAAPVGDQPAVHRPAGLSNSRPAAGSVSRCGSRPDQFPAGRAGAGR